MKKHIKKKRKAPVGEITKGILAAVGILGILVVGVAAPNALQILGLARPRRHSRKSLDQALRRLKRRGFISFVRRARGWRVELTEKGKRELLLFEAKRKLLRRPWRWGGQWYLLMFDIDEKRRRTRDAIRKMLGRLGFYRLQDSVWIFPYECDIILELLRVLYRVRREAVIVRADRITNDEEARRHFRLPVST